MNMEIIEKHCRDWSKETWREAYALYCQNNMFGPMTKQQYYDFVMERQNKLEESRKPISKDLIKKWIAGGKAAAKWAREHGCDLSGRTVKNTKDPHAEDIKDLQIAVANLNTKVK